MLNDDTPRGVFLIVVFLMEHQGSTGWFFNGQVAFGTQEAQVGLAPNPAGQTVPGDKGSARIVELLVMGLARDRPADGSDDALGVHVQLGFDGLTFFLTRVAGPRAFLGLLFRSVNDQSPDFRFREADFSLGYFKQGRQYRVESFQVPAHIALVQTQYEADEGLGGIGAIVQKHHK